MNNWKRAVKFVPAIWLAPKIQDTASLKNAVGRYIVGTLQNYETKQNPKYGNMDHFYQVLVTESSEKECHIYDPENKVNDGYTTVAAEFPNLYSIKASGLLQHILTGFWNNPEQHQGRPLKITYLGAKEYQKDNPRYDPKATSGPESMKQITVNSHQYSVDFDQDFTPALAGPQAAKELGHDAAVVGHDGATLNEVVEEPLPAFDPEA